MGGLSDTAPASNKSRGLGQVIRRLNNKSDVGEY